MSPEDLHASDYEAGLWVCVASLAILAGGVLLMGGSRRDTSPSADDPEATDQPAAANQPEVADEVSGPARSDRRFGPS
jgi:hypothetical protein